MTCSCNERVRTEVPWQTSQPNAQNSRHRWGELGEEATTLEEESAGGAQNSGRRSIKKGSIGVSKVADAATGNQNQLESSL